MAINPNIALQVQPQPAPDMLGSLAKVLQIKSEIAQQPLIKAQVERTGLENQQLTQNLGATKALNDAYKTAVVPGADGTPTLDKDAITKTLAAQGYGSQIPTVLEHFNAMEKTAGEVRKQKADLAESEQNYVGSLGSAAKAANYDPTVLATGLQHAVALGYQTAGQALQLLQSDPSKAQAIADNLIASSPAQAKLKNEADAAEARMLTAKTGQQRFNAELPGITAGNTVKQQQATGTQPISPAERLRLDIEKANAERAAAAQKETVRHNAVDETLGAGRLGVEQTRLAQTTGGLQLTPTQQSIADKLASGDFNPAQLTRFPDKEALIAAAVAKNPNWSPQTYATKKAFKDPQSKQSQNLGTISRIVGHIGRFEQNSKEMGTAPLYAAGVNITGGQNKLNNDAHAIAAELEKLVSGGVGTVGQVEAWKKGLSSPSAEARQQSIDEISQLIGSQYEGMNQTYKTGTGQDLPIEKYVSPGARAWMKAKGINAGGAAPAAGAGPKVGDFVNVRGKNVRITAIHSDGTFDGDPQ